MNTVRAVVRQSAEAAVMLYFDPIRRILRRSRDYRDLAAADFSIELYDLLVYVAEHADGGAHAERIAVALELSNGVLSAETATALNLRKLAALIRGGSRHYALDVARHASYGAGYLSGIRRGGGFTYRHVKAMDTLYAAHQLLVDTQRVIRNKQASVA